MAPSALAAGSRWIDDCRVQRELWVTVGAETEVLVPPRGKDIDPEMIVDLRRMLTNAGLAGGA
jgi:hypothetical protein